MRRKVVRITRMRAVDFCKPLLRRPTRGLTFTGLLYGILGLAGIALIIFGLKVVFYGRIIKSTTTEAIELLTKDPTLAWKKVEFTYKKDTFGTHEKAVRERGRFFQHITQNVLSKLDSAKGRTECFSQAKRTLEEFRAFDSAHPNEVQSYQRDIIDALHDSAEEFAKNVSIYSWTRYVAVARELKSQDYWHLDDDTHRKWIQQLEKADQAAMFRNELLNGTMKDALLPERLKGAAALSEKAGQSEMVSINHKQLRAMMADCGNIQVAGPTTTHTKYRLMMKAMINCAAYELMHLNQFDNEIRAGNMSSMEERGTKSMKEGEPLHLCAISKYMGELFPNYQVSRGPDFSTDSFGSGDQVSFPFAKGSTVRRSYVADTWRKLADAAKALPTQQNARDRELELLGAVCYKNVRLAAAKYQPLSPDGKAVQEFSTLPGAISWTRAGGLSPQEHAAIEAGSEAWIIY